ncbi:MAG: TlpA disulfide reductase family protein [Bacteroidota bacterium]
MNVLRSSFYSVLFLLFLFQQQIGAQHIWRGSLTTAGGQQIPFRLFLDISAHPPQGYFLNGSEQTKIPEIYFHNDSLELIFSEYKAAMIVTWTGSAWHGFFYRYRNDTTANEFSASPGETPSTAKHAHSGFEGKFKVYLFSGKICDSTMSANFWAANDSVYGTFIAPDGDFGLFAGMRQEDTVTLSRFTGWQAYQMKMKNEKGLWKGTLTSRTGRPEEFILIPIQSQSNLFRKEIITSMRNPMDHFSFIGITDAGDTIRSDGRQFKGKSLIVDIMGTWCHNCMDAAPLLQELYTEYQREGLEIVALSFEISSDPSLAKKNISLFRRRYGITYPVLFCGSTQEANIAVRLHSQLNNFSAYPTTIFIDKQGTVRIIHVGFHGRGTGDEYRNQIEKYRTIVKTILQTKEE